MNIGGSLAARLLVIRYIFLQPELANYVVIFLCVAARRRTSKTQMCSNGYVDK